MTLKGQLGRVSVALAFNAGLLVASVVLAQQPDPIEQERKGWDQVFAKEEMSFSKEPNAFLVRSLSTHAPGRALDVGMGQGRNTFWLAEHGWTVTGFDISPIAVEQARHKVEQRLLKAEMLVTPYQSFDWGREKWDLIVFCYFFPQEALPQVWESLRPGGLILVEGFHMDTGRMRPIGGGYTDKQMFRVLEKFRILVYEDVDERQDWGREYGKTNRLVRVLAQKPTSHPTGCTWQGKEYREEEAMCYHGASRWTCTAKEGWQWTGKCSVQP